jgi:two-component system response regulator (stage 0 sporulation protein A)
MGNIKVLVVDNNRVFVNEIKEYFRDYTNIDIWKVSYNSTDALKIIKKYINIYDVIVLNLLLPNKDGINILEEINRLKIKKKIIVISSCALEDIYQDIYLDNINYLIYKPFDFSLLRNKIIDCYEDKDKSIDIFHNKLQISVTKILHELGVPSNIKRYKYMRVGILLIYNNPSFIDEITKRLYLDIANTFKTSVSSVERSIRHAIEVSWNRGNWDLMEDIFGHSINIDKAKPTNSEFIVTIADKLRLDYCKSVI